MKKIAILGGMGPVATCHIFHNIIQYCQKKYGAIQDIDYPQILIDSIGLNDFNEKGIVDSASVLRQLSTHIHNISTYPDMPSVIGIACNTVHIFYDSLQSQTSIPIVHLPRKVVDAVVRDGHKKIGILASETSIREGLYTSELDRHALSYISPLKSEQKNITSVIEHVMEGNNTLEDQNLLHNIITRFVEKGCTAVILGCTELPVAMNNYTHPPISIFNCNQILAETLVDIAKNTL